MHLPKRLAKELALVAGKRVVMGTMTDPYQPLERQMRLTRQALQLMANAPVPPSKVGIFTRSPIMLDDLALIASLPKARVHMTVPPLPRDAQVLMEPIPVLARARWDAVAKLKAAGIRVHVNIAPSIPILSDGLVEANARMLAALGVDEFFVDSMQAYSDSFACTAAVMAGHPDWPAITKIIQDKAAYAVWKKKHRDDWMSAWKQVGQPGALPIWCDHETRVWEDMRTGLALDPATYDAA
jgi:DNA repair photolyase